MRQFEYIEFKQQRDFGLVLSTTFKFIRQNFKGLFRSIYAIGLPVTIVASFLMGSFYGKIIMDQGTVPEPVEFVMVGIGYLVYMFGFILVFASIFEYVAAYREMGTNQIPVSVVWKRVVKHMGAYIGSGILVTLMVALAPSLGMLMFAFADGGGMIALLVFVELGLFVFAIYLGGNCLYTQVAISNEGLGGVAAIKRSFWATKDNWWITFGISFVCNMIQSSMVMIIFLPLYFIFIAVMVFSASSGGDPFADDASWFGWLYGIVMFVYTAALFFTYSITVVALSLKFNGIVEEREGGGLAQRIETFGEAETEVDPESLI